MTVSQTSSYVGRAGLEEAAGITRSLADDYKTKGKGELPVDRIFYGYMNGRHGLTERQIPIKCLGSWTRIDYLFGGPRSGTFIELVVRRHGQEWQASQNNSELNKLLRAHGRMRALVIVDVSRFASIDKERLQRNYKTWVPSRGRFRRRHITVVYTSADATYNFGLRTGTAGTTITDT